jgi:hypothetical protein
MVLCDGELTEELTDSDRLGVGLRVAVRRVSFCAGRTAQNEDKPKEER